MRILKQATTDIADVLSSHELKWLYRISLPLLAISVLAMLYPPLGNFTDEIFFGLTLWVSGLILVSLCKHNINIIVSIIVALVGFSAGFSLIVLTVVGTIVNS
ncbi:hypothetical protein PL11_005395 [Lentilactobacillus curieae]|uniref:Uncharacterized protein n=1 Tax=Lentilactobacillus curieae TaxID=1138822 RepID=A0A1S6QIG1_9LACO|nr:hypothetical protein [Lentilactobacillus curieae]AQW21405.1 hypothetical protein PL11_005395 [Lentilactobacillus curieae]